MKTQSIVLWIVGAALVAVGYQNWGWMGVALVVGGIVMWMLLHFTRMMTVLKRAAGRPKGYIESAVMLNAKLKPGVNLLHVMALTRSIGEQLSEQDVQPEIFRWTDNGQSHVTCTFMHGKLQRWDLVRPEVQTEADPSAPPVAIQASQSSPAAGQ